MLLKYGSYTPYIVHTCYVIWLGLKLYYHLWPFKPRLQKSGVPVVRQTVCFRAVTTMSHIVVCLTWWIAEGAMLNCGQGSSVSIATDYGLDDPGSNPGGEEDFPSVQTGSGAHPAPCAMGTGSCPGGWRRPGRGSGPSPRLVPRS